MRNLIKFTILAAFSCSNLFAQEITSPSTLISFIKDGQEKGYFPKYIAHFAPELMNELAIKEIRTEDKTPLIWQLGSHCERDEAQIIDATSAESHSVKCTTGDHFYIFGEGDDWLESAYGNRVIYLGKGNDEVDLSWDSSIFIFEKGWGNDEIYLHSQEINASQIKGNRGKFDFNNTSFLVFGEGILPEDLAWEGKENLTLKNVKTGDSIKLNTNALNLLFKEAPGKDYSAEIKGFARLNDDPKPTILSPARPKNELRAMRRQKNIETKRENLSPEKMEKALKETIKNDDYNATLSYCEALKSAASDNLKEIWMDSATRWAHLNATKALIDCGLKFDEKSIISVAIYHDSDLDLIKGFEAFGANVLIKDSDGCTLLHFAAGDNALDTVKFLIEKGVNPKSACRRGALPSDWAQQRTAEFEAEFKRASEEFEKFKEQNVSERDMNWARQNFDTAKENLEKNSQIMEILLSFEIPDFDKKGLKTLHEKCAKKDLDACERLGEIYETGKGVAADAKIASAAYWTACFNGRKEMCVKSLTLDCDVQEMPQNCGALARYYKNGEGVKKDLNLAMKYYLKGCEGGNADSCRNLGILKSEQGEGEMGFSLLFKECENGGKSACYDLVRAYEKGKIEAAKFSEIETVLASLCQKDGGFCKDFALLYWKAKMPYQNLGKARQILEARCEKGEDCYWLGALLRNEKLGDPRDAYLKGCLNDSTFACADLVREEGFTQCKIMARPKTIDVDASAKCIKEKFGKE